MSSVTTNTTTNPVPRKSALLNPGALQGPKTASESAFEAENEAFLDSLVNLTPEELLERKKHTPKDCLDEARARILGVGDDDDDEEEVGVPNPFVIAPSTLNWNSSVEKKEKNEEWRVDFLNTYRNTGDSKAVRWSTPILVDTSSNSNSKSNSNPSEGNGSGGERYEEISIKRTDSKSGKMRSYHYRAYYDTSNCGSEVVHEIDSNGRVVREIGDREWEGICEEIVSGSGASGSRDTVSSGGSGRGISKREKEMFDRESSMFSKGSQVVSAF